MKLVAFPAYKAWQIPMRSNQIWSRSPVNPNTYDLVLDLYLTDQNKIHLTMYDVVREIDPEDPLYVDEVAFDKYLNPETE